MRHWAAIALISASGACWASLDPLSSGSMPIQEASVDGAISADTSGDETVVDAGTDACMADVDDDPLNCGRCGRDCLGGKCDAGRCQPILLATGENYPHRVAVDAQNVYWVNDGTPSKSYVDGQLRACAISGCNGSPQPYADNQRFPWGVGVDPTNVYFTNQHVNALLACPLQGCPDGGPALLMSHASGARAFAMDQTTIYVAAAGGGRILSCPLGGCGASPTTVCSGQGIPIEVRIDDTDVYWSDIVQLKVSKCPKTGCGSTPTVLASNLALPTEMAIDGPTLYFIDQGSGQILSCPKTGCGGNPTIVVSNLQTPWSLTQDATHLYFTTHTTNGTVQRCLKSSCVPEVLAAGLRFPNSVVVDAKAVYASMKGSVDYDGAIVKVAK